MTPSRLTDYLPAREDFARAIGFRRARTTAPEMLLGLGLFGAGLLIGSAAALILTPRNGAELREELRTRMSAVRDRLRPIRSDGEDRDSASA